MSKDVAFRLGGSAKQRACRFVATRRDAAVFELYNTHNDEPLAGDTFVETTGAPGNPAKFYSGCMAHRPVTHGGRVFVYVTFPALTGNQRQSLKQISEATVRQIVCR